MRSLPATPLTSSAHSPRTSSSKSAIRKSIVGRALVNGAEIGQGTGADVLGHPHHALAWLANHLASDGNALRAGEFVLTGSLVKTVWLNAGDQVMMELSELGSVGATFG